MICRNPPERAKLTIEMDDDDIVEWLLAGPLSSPETVEAYWELVRAWLKFVASCEALKGKEGQGET